jgi:hypothetical protein
MRTNRVNFCVSLTVWLPDGAVYQLGKLLNFKLTVNFKDHQILIAKITRKSLKAIKINALLPKESRKFIYLQIFCHRDHPHRKHYSNLCQLRLSMTFSSILFNKKHKLFFQNSAKMEFLIPPEKRLKFTVSMIKRAQQLSFHYNYS